jgi:hypothetical protein
MRQFSVLAILLFVLPISSISVASQNKPEANRRPENTDTRQGAPQSQSPTVQVNIGTPSEAITGQAAKQETKAEPRPFMTHGEWVLSVITAIYVLISYRTLRAIRKSSERQLRAYVLPESAGIYDGTTVTPPQQGRANIPGIAMLIKNSGQTPAYNVISWLQLAVVAVRDEYMLTVPPLTQNFPNTLGANGTFSKALWFDRQLTAGEIADIVSGVKAIYVYGRIEYRDTFKKKHFSNFRLHYTNADFPPQPNAIVNFSTAGNDAD